MNILNYSGLCPSVCQCVSLSHHHTKINIQIKHHEHLIISIFNCHSWRRVKSSQAKKGGTRYHGTCLVIMSSLILLCLIKSSWSLQLLLYFTYIHSYFLELSQAVYSCTLKLMFCSLWLLLNELDVKKRRTLH